MWTHYVYDPNAAILLAVVYSLAVAVSVRVVLRRLRR